jgi:hypothetical protein
MVRITDEGGSRTKAKALMSNLTERTSSNESSYCRPMLLASILAQIGFQFGISMVTSGGDMSIRTTQPGQGSNSARPMPTSFVEIRACHEDRVGRVQLAQESSIRHQILSQVFTTETDDWAHTTSSHHAQSTRRAVSWRRPKSSKLRSKCEFDSPQTAPILAAVPRTRLSHLVDEPHKNEHGRLSEVLNSPRTSFLCGPSAAIIPEQNERKADEESTENERRTVELKGGYVFALSRSDRDQLAGTSNGQTTEAAPEKRLSSDDKGGTLLPDRDGQEGRVVVF